MDFLSDFTEGGKRFLKFFAAAGTYIVDGTLSGGLWAIEQGEVIGSWIADRSLQLVVVGGGRSGGGGASGEWSYYSDSPGVQIPDELQSELVSSPTESDGWDEHSPVLFTKNPLTFPDCNGLVRPYPTAQEITDAIDAWTDSGSLWDSVDTLGPIPGLPVFRIPGTAATSYVDEIAIQCLVTQYPNKYYGRYAESNPYPPYISLYQDNCILSRSEIAGEYSIFSFYTTQALKIVDFEEIPPDPISIKSPVFRLPFPGGGGGRSGGGGANGEWGEIPARVGSWPVYRANFAPGISALTVAGENLTINGEILYA